MPFKLSYLNSNFALTLGYLNPALNNSALMISFPISPRQSLFSLMYSLPQLDCFVH